MFLAVMSEILGTTWWSILCFITGALIGNPLFKMLRSKMKF
ncbi:MAG: hypothetical protein Unbinned97contig1000_40 [Prokaryotic dsDNA virus sp.]|nr:MAG: hypothetical protein Unbinned97contig1000_40 [Prokaryotic dsDNA virus sp.]